MFEKQLEVSGLKIATQSGQSLVEDVHLELFAGDFTGIVGESGSGKTISTLASVGIVNSNLQAEVQAHQLLGRNLTQLSKDERNQLIGKEVGYIPQNTVAYLHPLIKIKNQMIDGYLKNISPNKKEALEKAAFLLEKVGILDSKRVLNLYPFELSGGMKQRVNIAAALMTDPKILIADEPTTALDTIIQRQVMDLLRALNKQGLSILFVSHDLNIIREYCEHIYVMSNGTVVETGKTSEVIAEPKEAYTRQLISFVPVLGRKG